MKQNTEQGHIKTALFVDFDNIYIGLKKLDEAAAENFATDPSRWLAWMEQGMIGPEETESPPHQTREVLIRRCYLNPRDFYRYRPNFTRSAFNVIDCPSLTTQGKNSADIYMVMDIIDTLEHNTHFDEFIIFSGDADFTPVLLRLRAYDRHTAVLAAGPASEAYKAACNLIIEEDVFIEYALGMSSDAVRDEQGRASALPLTPATEELLDRMASDLYAEASANGEILATDLPKLYLAYPEFRRDSNWLGFFALRSLTADLTRRNPELRITEGDPWRLTVRVPSRRKRAALPQEQEGDQPGLDGDTDDKLRRRIVRLVRRMVQTSDEPILMAKAAHDVTNQLGPQVIDTRWAGAGTFKNLLQSEDDLDIEIATSPSPGYLYDPKRHNPPSEIVEQAVEDKISAEMETLIGRIQKATGTPNLTIKQYAVLFRATADELKQNPYNLTRTSKAVRDRCIEKGESISRSNVSFILKGIIYKGHRFSKRDTARSLANIFRGSVLARCEDTELKLKPAETKLVDAWIMSGLNGS